MRLFCDAQDPAPFIFAEFKMKPLSFDLNLFRFENAVHFDLEVSVEKTEALLEANSEGAGTHFLPGKWVCWENHLNRAVRPFLRADDFFAGGWLAMAKSTCWLQ